MRPALPSSGRVNDCLPCPGPAQPAPSLMIFLCAAFSGGGGILLQVQSPVIQNIELSARDRGGQARRQGGETVCTQGAGIQLLRVAAGLVTGGNTANNHKQMCPPSLASPPSNICQSVTDSALSVCLQPVESLKNTSCAEFYN